ncbi:MAG: Ig-like domain repeat protein [Bauldia sp.]
MLSIDPSSTAACSVSSGVVSFTGAGICVIDANQGGDANYSAAAQLQQAVMVSAAQTTSSLQSVTFTATVTSNTSGTPTGSVIFVIDLAPQPPVALAAGVATLTTSTLAAGPHIIGVEYAGDGNYLPSSDAVFQSVNQIGTTTTVVSTHNPSNFGDPVTFTVTVTPHSGGAANGTVTLFIDGAAQVPVALGGSVVTFTTSSLSAADHTIGATYSGDASHSGSLAANLTQHVLASGSITIAEVTDGTDDTFPFTSSTPALNLSVATSGGTGRSAPVTVSAGHYTVAATSMAADGFALTSISCGNGSTTDPAAGTADIAVASGEAVTCTFSSKNTRKAAENLISDFLQTRGDIILDNQPDVQQQIDRLNGVIPGGDSFASNLMTDLMALAPVDGGPTTISTSLGAIRAAMGDKQPSAFDMWFRGTLGHYATASATGNFDLAYLGADYVVNRNLLVGGLFQLDNLSQDSTTALPSMASGLGWLAGPYATVRLSDNLFFDIRGEAGRSANKISPDGTYTDDVGATRWLFDSSLTGQWTSGAWTFAPGVRLSHFQETSDSYTDSLGVFVPQVATGISQVALSPALSYRFVLGDNTAVTLGARLSGILDFDYRGTSARQNGFEGQAQGTVGLQLPGGAHLGAAVNVGAQPDGTFHFLGGSLSASLPL